MFWGWHFATFMPRGSNNGHAEPVRNDVTSMF